ncbi:DUF2199 domain-containing protein [Amycolatopsis rhabdoformis]|uniref:DUF2199 domain-containing protein n=1 Tax=Amycolatopsis rhabdoformis TaxID=1448059 RepID=A0ABZ1I4X2_9PSEU|nr:DUF2199 domain-containing protein [Amycolatopsis rhabdoformis]WSE28538.1 DUF2199 domain-containing protein [Amycolatopsis rhabdoformis]
MPDTHTCSCCGKTLPADNLAWNFAWPDEIADLSKAERKRTLTFSSDAFLVSQNHGAAIRVILPIGLADGRTSTLGVWLGLAREDAQRVNDAARKGGDDWIGFTFGGNLLNEVRPWDTFFAEVTVTALENWGVPRVTASTSPVVQRLLTEPQPVEEYLRERIHDSAPEPRLREPKRPWWKLRRSE